MAGTRSSTRRASGESPASSQGTTGATSGRTGTKRKSEASPASKPKRGRKAAEKQQTTIEDALAKKDIEEAAQDVEMQGANVDDLKQNGKEIGKKTDAEDNLKAREEAVKAREDAIQKKEAEATLKNDEAQAEESTKKPDHAEKPMRSQPESNDNNATSTMDDTGKIELKHGQDGNVQPSAPSGDDAVEKSSQREASTPSSILEKGIIYFFFRGRVGIDEPSDVGDIARSYIVLRPLPHGAKLGDGPIGDDGNNRLLALPKKILPLSGRDRFMVFVEKAKISIEDIKNTVLTSSDYATKTAGTRHTPAATPVGEGVYAITTTGRESHLAYILTIPSELSEVQRDVGLQERGSFVTSLKNPQYAGPANTNLPRGPEFPKEILDEFRSLRWMPMQPKHLDYENAQLLLIGSSGDALAKATEQQPEDEKKHKDTPREELEKLEHEDELRVEHLKGDDTVFEDLGLSSKEYPKVPSTW